MQPEYGRPAHSGTPVEKARAVRSLLRIRARSTREHHLHGPLTVTVTNHATPRIAGPRELAAESEAQRNGECPERCCDHRMRLISRFRRLITPAPRRGTQAHKALE
jgi:hypothetical protein